MRAFVVLGLVTFHVKPKDWLGERLRNDIFCVECVVKPQLSQSNERCYKFAAHYVQEITTSVLGQVPQESTFGDIYNWFVQA